ncbi:MAG: hypothetical protein R3B95_20460 [Nitrospirales bacterium]|nr:hypothetical protein [Nitrospirales bacterium]
MKILPKDHQVRAGNPFFLYLASFASSSGTMFIVFDPSRANGLHDGWDGIVFC